jgi:hypothetical protein
LPFDREGFGMAFQVVGTDSTPGFGHGPDEDEYRVAEPRWRVSGTAGGRTLPAAGWIQLIRRLQERDEISLPG